MHYAGKFYWSDQFMSKKHIIGNKVTVTKVVCIKWVIFIEYNPIILQDVPKCESVSITLPNFKNIIFVVAISIQFNSIQ